MAAPRVCIWAMVSVVWLLSAALAAAAPTVWSGLTYSFSKPAGADYTDPQYQDHLTSNIALTRGDSAGMYNILQEDSYEYGSPADTEWATEIVGDNGSETIAATNWENLDFTTWEDAYGSAGQLAGNMTALDAVVHLITDDIYLDLRFTSWGTGHSSSQGGFAYQRAEPVPEPASITLLLLGALALRMCVRRSRD